MFLASQLVGPTGKVYGVDMTEEQLAIAKEYQGYHSEKFGYANTEFVQGYLEDLGALELDKSSFDLIISNCVINLCTDKQAVLRACRDLLKPGGEMYFSDVYANRRVPTSLQQDKLLWGECLSGALYWNDFENLAKRVGFPDPRLVEDSRISIKNQGVADLIESQGHGGLEFYSATYRLFALDEALLEPACENHGQAVMYLGTIPRASSFWKLDKGHVFQTGTIQTVCGNTFNMLKHNPRLTEHFDFMGDFSRHFGRFEGCEGGGRFPFDRDKAKNGATPCC